MPFPLAALSWVSMLAIVVPLALMFLLALPTGALGLIAAHAVLLVAGAAIVLAIESRDEE